MQLFTPRTAVPLGRAFESRLSYKRLRKPTPLPRIAPAAALPSWLGWLTRLTTPNTKARA